MAPRQLTTEEKRRAVEGLTGGVGQVFTDAYNLFTDRPGFIADDEPATALATAVRDVNRYTCRLWARNPADGFQGSAPARMARVCGPYLEGIGENPVEGAVEGAVEGGQCPGVSYNVTITGNRADNGQPFTISRPGEPGPIEVVPTGAAVSCPAGSVTNEQYLFRSGGLDRFSFNGANCGPFKTNFRVIAVRADGQPDTCGSQPPFYVPPSPVGGLPPLPLPRVNIPGLGDVNVGVEFRPEGAIAVTFPDLGIEVDLGPEQTGDEPGPGDGGGADPTDPGQPGTPVAPGEGGEADGEADDGEELVGLLVEVLSAPPEASRFQNNAKQPYRGIGYVRMGYPGRLGVDVSGGTVISPQFFHAPQRGLTSWAVSANVGFSLRTTPYYRTTTS